MENNIESILNRVERIETMLKALIEALGYEIQWNSEYYAELKKITNSTKE